LRRINKEYESWYTNLYGDIYLGDTAQIVSEEEVDVLSLDEAIIHHKAVNPDIISIDAEGASYDILEGAPKSLGNAVAVICEVEFDEIWRGQKTFFDIGNLLKDNFIFAGFIGEEWRYSPHRCPIGFRGLAFPLSLDALFLRKKQTINSDSAMAKLAFMSFIHGFIEYGFYAALSLDESFFLSEKLRYLRFIDELIQLYKNETHVYKPTFRDINKTKEEAYNRYIRYHINDVEFLRKKRDMELKILSLRGAVTDLEKIFLKYDMPDVAQIIHGKNQEIFYIR
jgi:hypothetical protein